MNGESLNIKEDNLNKLKSILPEVFSEDKVDWEKLKAHLGDNIVISNERYTLNWAGKSDAFKVLQQPTTATLKPAPEESIDFDTTENVFIEGENLEVLKVLQKSYYGKIKCIIIDPPYNTGSDSFIYPDSFKESKAEYEKRIGDKDEDGYLMKEGYFRKNSKDSGHFHSNWLSMMYPRLFLAKNLMCDDGVIFVHIDDNEVHNLRLVMNEIFGEENFIGQISRATGTPTGQGTNQIVSEIDYILVYSKQTEANLAGLELTEKEQKIYNQQDDKGQYLTRPLRKTGGEDRREDRPSMYFPVIDPDGNEVYPIGPGGYESRWRCSPKKYKEYIKDNLIEWKKIKENNIESWKPYLKFYLEGRLKQISNLWQDIAGNKKASVDLKNLFDSKVFDYPKPVEVIKKAIAISTSEDDIVLDFFAGSGTTAQAVYELNKENGSDLKFVLVQLPEICDEESEAFKAGFKTISEISKERIRRVIGNIQKEKTEKPDLFESPKIDLGFKVFKLISSNFKIWRGNEITEENLTSQLDAFTNPLKEGSEKDNMFYELLLKAGYKLTDKVDKRLLFYSVKDNELIIVFDKLAFAKAEIITKALPKPKKVITLDNLFSGDDQLKTNTVLQMKDAGIEFKTI